MTKHDYPFDIPLEESWLDFDIKKYMEAKDYYQKALQELNQITRERDKPVVAEVFTKDYYYQDDPEYLVTFWKQVDDYIKENESETWMFCSIASELVDVNTDPYDDYEHETMRITVYAQIKSEDDFTKSREYQDMLRIVDHWYKELIEYKNRIDSRFKREK